jgi:hypothetical protein
MKKQDKNWKVSPLLQNRYYSEEPILVCRECGMMWDYTQVASMACPECFSSKIREASCQEEFDFRHEKYMEGFL